MNNIIIRLKKETEKSNKLLLQGMWRKGQRNLNGLLETRPKNIYFFLKVRFPAFQPNIIVCQKKKVLMMHWLWFLSWMTLNCYSLYVTVIWSNSEVLKLKPTIQKMFEKGWIGWPFIVTMDLGIKLNSTLFWKQKGSKLLTDWKINKHNSRWSRSNIRRSQRWKQRSRAAES